MREGHAYVLDNKSQKKIATEEHASPQTPGQRTALNRDIPVLVATFSSSLWVRRTAIN